MPHVITVGPLGVNVYIVDLGDGNSVVVDPGAEPETIMAELDRFALVPVLVALTHGHLDHTAAIPGLARACETRGWRFSVAIHEADGRYLGSEAEATNLRVFDDIGASSFFKRWFSPMPEANTPLRDGDLLPGTGIAVIHTPGHTAGSCCFLLPDGGGLLSGDTLFRGGVGRTDGFDSGEAELYRSITTRLMALPPETMVYPGHGGSTTIRAEARRFPRSLRNAE
ncbi:MAG: MBL fold metallo-hydrolase [Spirochaetes bacterium]|nr:MBL fold metallo-hydrolase [Spirochaetota bacterium]